MEQSQERLNVLNKIKVFENANKFNEDVENDAPAKPIMPKDVDYLNKRLSNKIATYFANICGKMFFNKMKKNNKLIIKQINGVENLEGINGGAIVTCNHFNLVDNYLVNIALKPLLGKRKLYKVIKESNYTNFKGIVKFIMRHCNTLPLSSNMRTMTNFYTSIDVLLQRGETILIYPEKAMWWNYKKPRPMLDGAFKLACKNDVPIIPIFITMQDSFYRDDNGFPVQEHTIHILPPIYKDLTLSTAENVKEMKARNYQLYKEIYETTYNKKLEYTCGKTTNS
ncbi:MAG: 1-acyl-sn-glycerol-3-phosphate acyltransferase [Clostridia bacterium]|nr:1-acyl-sn-glycerol-3-phosphate acyltransferase [Clostridia bacterium]MBQ8792428.1 1-acyl-sn-glycerol-3-phosphate acyltransferase [Clostridia bacterium]